MIDLGQDYILIETENQLVDVFGKPYQFENKWDHIFELMQKYWFSKESFQKHIMKTEDYVCDPRDMFKSTEVTSLPIEKSIESFTVEFKYDFGPLSKPDYLAITKDICGR